MNAVVSGSSAKEQRSAALRTTTIDSGPEKYHTAPQKAITNMKSSHSLEHEPQFKRLASCLDSKVLFYRRTNIP